MRTIEQQTDKICYICSKDVSTDEIKDWLEHQDVELIRCTGPDNMFTDMDDSPENVVGEEEGVVIVCPECRKEYRQDEQTIDIDATVNELEKLKTVDIDVLQDEEIMAEYKELEECLTRIGKRLCHFGYYADRSGWYRPG